MKHLLLIALLLVTACATDSLSQFSKVQDGMDKDQVLEILGNPQRTEKQSGADKWGYRYFSGENKETQTLKYVRFINGKVVSFGDDQEEQERLEKIKENSLKKEALRKKQKEVEEKVQKEYQKKPAKSTEEENSEE